MKSRKILAVMSAVLMLGTMISCSSDRNNNAGDNSTVTIEQNSISHIYKKAELPYPNDVDKVTDFLYDEASGKIYIFGTDVSGEIKCCVTDSDFNMYKSVDFNIDYNNIKNPEDSIALELFNDKLYAVTTHVDHGDKAITDDTDYDEYMRSAEYTYNISVFSLSGEMISSNIINDTDKFIDENSSFKSVRNVVCAEENRIIIMLEQQFLLVDTDGNILGEINPQNDNTISDIVRFTNGQIVCNTNLKGSAMIRDIDLSTMKYGDYKASFSENISGAFSYGTGDYLAYISDSNSFYGLKDDNTIEKIIDFVSSGLNGLSNITPIADGDFVCCDGQNKIVRLTERDEAEYAEIQDITLAVAGKYDDIQGKISEFNAQSTRYRINIKDYSEAYEYSVEGLDNAVKDLEMDIASGHIPDVVYLDSNEIQKLSSKGIFTDLYDFIDNDKTCSRDAFLPNILSACETDGHLYSLAPTFQIRTIAAKTKFADTENWTFSEFKNIYETFSDEMELFEMGNNNKAVMHFLTNGGSDFVDYSNNTCSFDSAEFIQLLEFANSFPSVDMYDFDQKSCRNDTALLSTLYIDTFRDFNVEKQSIFNEDITFVGYPTNNGNGSRIILSEQFAIMESSQNKDGAWELLRNIFDAENIDPQISGIPITEKGFKIVTEAALEKPYYIDESLGGTKTYWNEVGYDSCTGAQINITPMNESDKAFYEKFVRSLTAASSGISDNQVSSILSEETDSYFAGECSAQQCADIIQDRVSIMLSEQN